MLFFELELLDDLEVFEALLCNVELSIIDGDVLGMDGDFVDELILGFDVGTELFDIDGAIVGDSVIRAVVLAMVGGVVGSFDESMVGYKVGNVLLYTDGETVADPKVGVVELKRVGAEVIDFNESIVGDEVGALLSNTDGVVVVDSMVGAVELVTFGGEVGDFEESGTLSEDLELFEP